MQRLDDAAQMRALAHPTRLRLVGLLRTGGPQTAAMLGDQVDEAPGTISYHCKRLADAGFIEPAPEIGTDRRERWWRAVAQHTSWDLADAFDDPDRMLAATALDRTVAQAYATEYAAFVDRAPAMGRDWVAASTAGTAVCASRSTSSGRSAVNCRRCSTGGRVSAPPRAGRRVRARQRGRPGYRSARS